MIKELLWTHYHSFTQLLFSSWSFPFSFPQQESSCFFPPNGWSLALTASHAKVVCQRTKIFITELYYWISLLKQGCFIRSLICSRPLCCCLVTKLHLTFATPGTVALQAPLSMAFSRQEYWSGLPFPSPGDLLHPGIEPVSPVSLALAAGFFTTVPPGKPMYICAV